MKTVSQKGGLDEFGRNDRLTLREAVGSFGKLSQGCYVAGGCAAHAFLAGEAGEQLAVADEVHHERAGVLEQARVLVGAQNLGGRNAHAIEAAGRTLGATDGRLASRQP